MCPACVAAVAVLVAGVVSTGGVAAVAAKLFPNHKPLEKVSEAQIPKAEENSKCVR